MVTDSLSMRESGTKRLRARLGNLILVALFDCCAGHSLYARDPHTVNSGSATSSFPELFATIEQDMVTIQGGKFIMGDAVAKEPSVAKPVHIVSVNSFKMSRYEVTFAQYDAYAATVGKQLPDDHSWGRGHRPVVEIGWYDAKAFIEWLNQQTGRQYRLPSEAEWEYAARAKSTTDYPWGTTFDPSQANGRGTSGLDVWPYTAPVGSFPPNAWGLFDMIGNVMEWTADCWNANYVNAPTDGSAWLQGSCRKRVFRGGAWALDPEYLKVSFRMFVDASFHNQTLGFRLAEDR
jgi:formylglycine-generating enzyme required for sulfatase activity